MNENVPSDHQPGSVPVQSPAHKALDDDIAKMHSNPDFIQFLHTMFPPKMMDFLESSFMGEDKRRKVKDWALPLRLAIINEACPYETETPLQLMWCAYKVRYGSDWSMMSRVAWHFNDYTDLIENAIMLYDNEEERTNALGGVILKRMVASAVKKGYLTLVEVVERSEQDCSALIIAMLCSLKFGENGDRAGVIADLNLNPEKMNTLD